jgi:hypothetical protein
MEWLGIEEVIIGLTEIALNGGSRFGLTGMSC